MKNIAKIFRIFLAGSFIFSLTFCCCLTKNAQASEKAVPSCHQKAAKDNKTDSPQHCACPKTISSAEVKAFSLDKLAVNSLNFILPVNSIAVLTSPDSAFQLVRKSPTSDFFKIPLYIIQHNFRI